MIKIALLGALVAATLPAIALASPTFQPAATATVTADDKAATTDAARDAEGGVTLVREGGTRGRGRP